MPKVFDWNGYRFYFYSDEGNPREPMHIHIEKADADAKFWLYPEVELAYNHGFNARVIRLLQAVVENRRSEIERVWRGHFG